MNASVVPGCISPSWCSASFFFAPVFEGHVDESGIPTSTSRKDSIIITTDQFHVARSRPSGIFLILPVGNLWMSTTWSLTPTNSFIRYYQVCRAESS